MTTVRIEVDGQVLRLFPTELVAQTHAVGLARGALERFVPVLHASGLGWLVHDKESGRLYDDAGLAPAAPGVRKPVVRENVTKDGIEVKVGQVWRDLDKRMGGRTVTVLAVAAGKASVMGAAKSRLSISRMHKASTGWALQGST